MSLLRRSRGAILRLVRQRRLAMVLGLVMIGPSAYIQFGSRFDTWWLEGLSLVVGATGLALLWTGLTGVGPDWVDDERQ
jgi:ABC-type transport system involved in cytochrome c biogenesis permease component